VSGSSRMRGHDRSEEDWRNTRGRMCSHRREFFGFLTWNKQGGKSASGAWRSNSMNRLLSFVIAIEVLGLITACQTTSTERIQCLRRRRYSDKQGFKWKTVTTPKQQERVSALPEGKVSALNTRDEHITCIPPRPKTGSWLATRRSKSRSSTGLVRWESDRGRVSRG
jgi:hypothetical protein